MIENVSGTISSQTDPFQHYDEPNDARTTQGLPFRAIVETDIGDSIKPLVQSRDMSAAFKARLNVPAINKLVGSSGYPAFHQYQCARQHSWAIQQLGSQHAWPS